MKIAVHRPGWPERKPLGLAWALPLPCLFACTGADADVEVQVRSLALGKSDPVVAVAFTFDDTLETQIQAAHVLEREGLRGTFYVNAPRLYQGSRSLVSHFMSTEEALELEARGHEIGGHTLSHPFLTRLGDEEQRREVQNDRLQLSRLGFDVRSFAYPNGDVENDSAPSAGVPLPEIVRAAGYFSARDTNGLGLASCVAPPFESLPALDAMRLRSHRSVSQAPPARAGQPAAGPDGEATLWQWLDRAASCGGGFVPLVFHHVLPDCFAEGAPERYCFPLDELESFARGVAAGRRCPDDGGACYSVRGAPVAALLDAVSAPAPEEVPAIANAQLERARADGQIECLQLEQSRPGVADLSHAAAPARSGDFSASLRLNVDAPEWAEARLVRDTGACAALVTPGRAYELSMHYRIDPEHPAPTLRFVVHRRLAVTHRWVEWTRGRAFVARGPGWVRRAFVTRPVPAQTEALSFGLRAESPGVAYLDDLAIEPLD